MKKLVALLVLCVVFAFCTVNFTACDFSVPNNSGKEIINVNPEDKDKNGENNNSEENNQNNNNEENIVITADTDFDALVSDKVEKDVFINAFVFLGHCTDLYSPAHENCTIDMYQNDGNVEKYFTMKIDGLKVMDTLHYETIKNPYIYDDDNNIVGEIGVRRYGNRYLLLVDTEYYIEYSVGNIGGQRLTHVEKYLHPVSAVNYTELKAFVEKAWDNATYNETTKQYEISQIEFDHGNYYDNIQIKIKDGYIVYFGYTNEYGTNLMKCYDIGTTVVDIPADILAEMNAKK